MESNQKNLSERLRLALKVLGVSQTELARRINVKPQIIQYLCAGNSEKSKFLFDIAEALKIDVLWLATGNGENPSLSKSVSTDNSIPVLTHNQVKEWKVLNGNLDLSKSTFIPINRNINVNSFAIVLNDQSMAPRFNIDTIIIIDPHVDPLQIQQQNQFVLVYLAMEDFLVFRQLEIVKNIKKILPINNNLYKHSFMTDKDIILGVCKEARWSI